MAWLASGYDAIIIDAAPMTEWVTAHLFVRVADQCVYAVRWNSSDAGQVTTGMRRLAFSDLKGGIGMVLTRGDDTEAA